MERTKFPIGPSQMKNWEQVFDNPGPIQLHTVETGNTTVPLAAAVNLKHPNAKELQNEPVQLPIFAHLIRHETFGDYLIDCGLDTSHQRHPYGVLRGLLVRVLLGESHQEKGQDIATYLRENGIQVKGAFLTHLHFDHIAGILDLPQDMQYIVGQDERPLYIRFLYYGSYLENVETLHEIDFSEGNEMDVLGQCADVFGDGSFWAIPTPGHTKGHTSFLVNAPQGPILIMGDACLLKVGFENGIGPGSHSANVQVAQQSLDNLSGFAERYPQVKLVYGHELPNDE